MKDSWTEETRKIKVREPGTKRWWNKKCSKLKRSSKRKYYKWRAGKGIKEEYLEERKEWKNMRRESEKEWKKDRDAELKAIKNENEVWKFINKYRKKKKNVNSNIKKTRVGGLLHETIRGIRNEKVGRR